MDRDRSYAVVVTIRRPVHYFDLRSVGLGCSKRNEEWYTKCAAGQSTTARNLFDAENTTSEEMNRS